MRHAGVVAAVAAVVLLAVNGAGAAGAPVEVNAGAGWVQTSVWIQPGQTLSVSAVGQAFTTRPAASTPNVYFHPDPGTGREGRSGPEGQQFLCTSFNDGTCAVENAPYGQLVGRVGGSVFSIGDAPSFTVPAAAPAGLLELAVNDLVEWYFDNSGSYNVKLQ